MKARQKVFGSSVSTTKLKKAVASKRVATSTGARIVREVEATLPKGEVPKAVIDEAKKKVDAKVADVDARPRGKKKTRSTSTPKPDETVIDEAKKKVDAKVADVDARPRGKKKTRSTSTPKPDEAVVAQTPPSVPDAVGLQDCTDDGPKNPTWSDQPEFAHVLSAVREILTGTRNIRRHLSSLHPKRLTAILSDVVAGDGEEGEENVASKLVNEDKGALLVEAALMLCPRAGADAKLDALRRQAKEHMAAGRPTECALWGLRLSRQISSFNTRRA